MSPPRPDPAVPVPIWPPFSINRPPLTGLTGPALQIGRASCRERVQTCALAISERVGGVGGTGRGRAWPPPVERAVICGPAPIRSINGLATLMSPPRPDPAVPVPIWPPFSINRPPLTRLTVPALPVLAPTALEVIPDPTPSLARGPATWAAVCPP